MAITQAVCSSFKADLLRGNHDLDGDTLKIALYTSSASLDATTTAYTVSGEATGGAGYTTGGFTLYPTGGAPFASGTVAFMDFADVSVTSATFSCAGALIINSTFSDASIAVLSFGGTYSVANGTFRIIFPAPDGTNAILRLS